MSTESLAVHSSLSDSAEAGRVLGRQISEAFKTAPPDALIVFASSQHDYTRLLQAIEGACHPKVMIGCSSAGEFTGTALSEGSVSAIALRSDRMQFSAGIGRGLRFNREKAAHELADSFKGPVSPRPFFRSALILTDALAGFADDLIQELNILTGGVYQFFGGGAGDDAKFQRTHVFFGTEAVTDAVVTLEILSERPIGIGVRHDWIPASPPMRVTASDGMRLVSLNAIAAADIFKEHAETTGQDFSKENPMPFFLHNIIGIEVGKSFKLRVPLGIESDGSILCAANIPSGATIRIMKPAGTAAEAVISATRDALDRLQGQQPQVALFFDCVASRLRMGKEFGYELKALQQALGNVTYAGCNTYGQIAHAEGQFSGFHNCTAVVCVFPE